MYWLYEASHAALNPARAVADATKLLFKNPLNPLSMTQFGKSMAAAAEVFERSTRRYARPEWGITSTLAGGVRVPVHVEPIWERPFCRLLISPARSSINRTGRSPRMLIVAPLSGHYATLLRGTVEASCPITTSSSPIGSTPAWCRSPPAGSISTIISITSSRSCISSAATFTSSACAAVGAGGGGGRPHGGGGRSLCAALDDPDGRDRSTPASTRRR